MRRVRGPVVGDLMTHPVVSVVPAMPFKNLVRLLDQYQIGAVPVVDGHDRPVGVVSESDLLAKEDLRGADRPPSAFAPGRRWRWWGKSRAMTAETAMTRRVRVIGQDEPVAVAARRLAREHLRRLYVVDGDGKLVGVLARRDVLRVFLRPDAEIARAVEEEVLRRCLWAAPEQARAEVVDGVVTLTGTVDRRSEAERAARLTEAIPGVVAVANELNSTVDDRIPG